jgi:hypothetical protein
VSWKEGGEGHEQSRLFGADPVFIDEDVLAAVVKGLNRQSAGAFRESSTGGTKLLLRFARMMTYGTYYREAVRLQKGQQGELAYRTTDRWGWDTRCCG